MSQKTDGSIRPQPTDERLFDHGWVIDYTRWIISRIVAECPSRWPASPDESKAQEILHGELTACDSVAECVPYRFNSSLYGVIALHFALAILAGLLVLVHPAIALITHLLVAISYFGDSQKRFFLLRRLLPWSEGHNLIVTYPAQGEVRSRVVLLAHADAAPTGWIFRPALARLCNENRYGGALTFLRKPLLVAVIILVLVILIDLVMLTAGRSPWWLTVVYVLGHGYFLSVVLLTLQVVLNRQVVDGANDNLTSCAAIAVLARRFAAVPEEGVELVFGITGGEEAGDGGSSALARDMRGRWDPSNTLVVALECLGSGQLRVLEDGELFSHRTPDWLMTAVEQSAGAHQQPISRYRLPAGCTDVLPFLVRGYEGTCFVRIDPNNGVPENYHLPGDRPENLSYRQLAEAIDFTERFVREVSRLY